MLQKLLKIKNSYFLAILLFISGSSFSQCPQAPADITIPCNGSTTLTATTSMLNYTVVTTTCTPVPIAGTTAFPVACDDCVTGQIPIGFPFNFYGNIYNTAVIQSNGIVGFGPFTFTGFSSFAIPAGGAPNNYIAGFFADIDIRYGGTITYQTVGTAPNRQFVVSYNNVVPYNLGSGAGTGTASFQIVLNENGSFNVIVSQLSANWNASTSGALATSGAENSDGTYAFPVPGRNSTDWPGIVPGNQDCHLFNPVPCIFQRWEIAGTSVSTNVSYSITPTATTTYTGVWNCSGNICTDDVIVTVPIPPTTTPGSMCQGGTATMSSNSCGSGGTPVSAGTVFNSGALTNTDPTWERTYGGTTCTATGTSGYYYDVFSFTVSTGGAYTFDGCFPTIDGYGQLYQNAFNPASPCGIPANFIVANDDTAPLCGADPQLVANLVPGVTYYIISTTFSVGATDTYSWTFTGPAGGQVIPGTGGVVQWYTAATGGAPIGTGSPFSPVGVAGSGVANSSSTGNYTFYAACSSAPDCRTATSFVISPNSTPATSISGGATICHGQSVTLSVVGGSLATGAQWEWFTGSCGGTAAGTGASITVSPTATTTYFVRASAGSGCAATTCVSTNVTLPTLGTTLANNGESATCVVNQTGYVHFYHSSGRLITSINSNGQNLGNVTVTAYTGTPVDMPACTAPSYITTAMGRRWVINPQFQPTTPIDVALHFDNTELAALVTAANGNSNPEDNLSVIGDLKLSKYAGPNNVDNTPLNNCPATGGNGGTTIHGQASNGTTASMRPGFSATASFARYSVNSCSEFWLHGHIIFSPLATELQSFSANCADNNRVKINWTTASESNCSNYRVEKSGSEINWKEVQTVTCSSPSNTMQNYEITDQERMSGFAYYRLVEINDDGEVDVLSTVSVTCDYSETSMIAYPNPASSEFMVQINSTEKMENVTLILTDLSGKIVDSRSLNLNSGSTNATFNTDELSNGTYLVSVRNLESQMKPIKIIIQK